MALVGKHHVLRHAAAPPHRLHDLVGLDLQHTGIVRSLEHEQGPADLVRVEQRRDAVQPHRVRAVGIAHLGIERLAERFPPRRDAAQRAHPVRDPEQIDAGREHLRAERHGREREIPAVAATHDRDAACVHVAQRREVALRPHQVVQVGLAVPLVIQLVERLAVAARAAIVHRQHDIAMIRDVLHEGVVPDARLSPRAAVDPQRRRHAGRRGRLERPVEQGRDGEPVVRRKPHHLRLDQVRGIQVGAQVLGQLAQPAPRRRQIQHVQVARGAAAVHVQRQRPLTRRDLHAPDLAHGNARQGDAAVRRRLVHADLGAGVGVDAHHEVRAVLGEVREIDVPARVLHRVPPPGRQVVAREPGEFAPLVGRVVEVLSVRAERLRVVLHVALVRAHVPHVARLHVPQVHLAVLRRDGALQRHPAPVGGDRPHLIADRILKHASRRERRHRHLEHVEETPVAAVGGVVERAVVPGPVYEHGLETVPRREITRRARRVEEIEVIVLITAGALEVQHAPVVRQIPHREDAVGGRVGERARLSAGGGDLVGVEDSRLVARDEDRALVR